MGAAAEVLGTEQDTFSGSLDDPWDKSAQSLFYSSTDVWPGLRYICRFIVLQILHAALQFPISLKCRQMLLLFKFFSTRMYLNLHLSLSHYTCLWIICSSSFFHIMVWSQSFLTCDWLHGVPIIMKSWWRFSSFWWDLALLVRYKESAFRSISFKNDTSLQWLNTKTKPKQGFKCLSNITQQEVLVCLISALLKCGWRHMVATQVHNSVTSIFLFTFLIPQ